MTEILSILEGAFFFAIPPLLFFALFGEQNVLRTRPRKVLLWFCLIIFGYVLPLLIRRNNVSRYYMPSALFLAMFAGGGAAFLTRMLGRLLFRSRWERGILILLTAGVCMSTALRQATAGRKPFIRSFAEQLSAEKSTKILLLGIKSSDCLKIAARVNATGRKWVIAKNCNGWQDVIEQYLVRLPEDQDAYILLHGKESGPEIAEDVRTRYYSFPFEEVLSMDYRHTCFRLLRFNRRTGDGLINRNRADILDRLPEPLELKKQGAFIALDLADYIPETMRTADDFIIGRCGSFSRSEGMRWQIKETWDPDSENLDLLYFDSLCWPVACRAIRTVFSGDRSAVSPAQKGQNKSGAKLPPSEAPPLYPDEVRLYGGGGSIDYFWREFAPADGRAARLEATLPGNAAGAVLMGDKLTIRRGTPAVELHLKDRLLQTETRVTVRLAWTTSPGKDIAEKKWKIAVVGTADFTENTGKHLAALLKQGRVDCFKLPEGIPENGPSLVRACTQIADFPVADHYDYLVFEPFLINVLAHRNFAFDTGMFEENFTALLRQLRRKIPAKECVLLIPPAPVGEDVPYASNARQARMDHFRLNWLLTGYLKRHSPEMPLVSLPGVVAPEENLMSKASRKSRSAYSCLPSCYRKYAEYLCACLMVLEEQSK